MKTAKFILCLLMAFHIFGMKEALGQDPASGTNDNPLTGGNVGIGTTNPIEKFHLEGGNFLHRTVNPFIFFDNTNAVGNTGIAFKYTGNWKGWLYYNENEDHLMINAEEGAGYRPDIVIKSYGWVGIGTTNPLYKFHVEGDMILNDYYPFLHLNNTDETGNAGIQFKTLGMNKGTIYYDDFYDHLIINTDAGSYRPDIVLKPDGLLGIGTSTPSGKLHVTGSLPGYTGIFGTHIAPWSAGTNLSVGNTGEDAALYVGQGGTHTGYLWWDYNVTPANGSFRIGTYNGQNPIYLQPYGGSVRVGDPNAVPGSLFEVYLNANNYAQLGFNNVHGNFFFHLESPDDGEGQAAIYGYRTRSSQNDGTYYGLLTSNSAIKGYSLWGDLYTFGTAGFSDNDYSRCGGVLGAHSGGSYWGSLGYRSSNYTYYGGYFCAYGTGIGGGKGPLPEYTGIGIGAWGELLGADIHGKVYGSYIEGENYALFTNGTVYKNDLDIHLQSDGRGENIVLYTHASTDVTVQTCGVTFLAGGRASVSFDPSFKAAVSRSEPVVVTVTPVGNSNGVYLSEVSPDGFKVVENNEGRSNVMVNYIAIGRRAGYENPTLPHEVIDGGYVEKMTRGLHNDADTQTNGEGVYYENGQLIVGIHPSTLPDLNKKPGSAIDPNTALPVDQNTAGYSKASGSK